ncbi:MAG: AAA family ATPase [Phycisphaerae bacterium]|jgi:type II secretory pathway predicted ATPase ExeA/chromosome segregation ATPase
MYCDFFGLRCRPFEDRADTQFCYAHPDWEESLAATIYETHHGRGIALLVGDGGTGKTLMVRTMLQRLEPADRAIVLTWPPLPGMDLMRETCKAFGVTLPESDHQIRYYTRLRRNLVRAAVKGHRSILIIDQAENLASDHDVRWPTGQRTPGGGTQSWGEQLAALSEVQHEGGNVLSIVLVGQPSLVPWLEESHNGRLASRVSSHRSLRPITCDQTGQYIQHRLRVAGAANQNVFSGDAIALIHQASRGVPRLINHMADAAMLGAYGAEQSTVSAAIVSETLGQARIVERTAHARTVGVSTAETLEAGLSAEHHAVAPGEAVAGKVGCAAASLDGSTHVATTPSGPSDLATTDVDQHGEDRGYPESPLAAGNLADSDTDFVLPDIPLTPEAGLLNAAETQLYRLERASDRAERVAATTDASLARFTATEKHLASLLRNAETLVARATGAIQDTTTAEGHLQRRAEQIVDEADRRLKAIETQAAEVVSIADDVTDQKNRIEQTCKLAEQTELRLRSSAEQIADKADEVQQRIALLMSGLDASDEKRHQLGTLMDQASKASAEASETIEALREAQRQGDGAVQRTRTQIDAAIEQASTVRVEAETLQHDLTTTVLDRFRKQLTETLETHLREEQRKIEEMRETVSEQLATQMRQHQEAMERNITNYRTMLAEITDDGRRHIANLGEAANTCRRKADEALAESEAALTAAQASVTARTDSMRCEIESISVKSDQTRALLDATSEELRELEVKADALRSTTTHTESDINKLTDRAAIARTELDNTVNRGERLVGAVQSAHNQLEALQRQLGSTLVEFGGASERADATLRQVEQNERALGETIARQEQAKRLVERLTDLSKAANEVHHAAQTTVEDAASKLDRLDASTTAAEPILQALETSCETGRTLLERSETATVSATQAAADAHEQATHLSALLASTQPLVHELDGAALSTRRLHEEIRTAIADADVKGDRLEAQTKTSARVLSELTQANETGCSLIERAKDATSATSSAIEDAERWTGQLTDARDAADEAVRQLDELARSARQLHESMQGAVAHADDKLGQLDSHQAAAKHLVRTLAEENVDGHTLVQRLSESTETLEKKAQEVTNRIEGRVQEVQNLINRTDDGVKELRTRSDHADEIITRIAATTEPAERLTEQLAQCVHDARHVADILTERYDETRDLPDTLDSINQVLASAKETSASVEGTVSTARHTLEQILEATDRAAEQHGRIIDASDATQKVIDDQQKAERDLQEATEKLESHASSVLRSTKLGEPLLHQFIQQARTLEQQLQQLQDEADAIEGRLGGTATHLTELTTSAQAQASQLEQVCTAVKKVFRALSQATLDARQHSSACQMTAENATNRLAQLSTETDRAANTLHEWVEEALRVQSRLERTLHACPSIQDTHPASGVRRIAEAVCPTSHVANPSATALSRRSERNAATSAEPTGTPSPRADEIARLIDDAKSAVAAADD